MANTRREFLASSLKGGLGFWGFMGASGLLEPAGPMGLFRPSLAFADRAPAGTGTNFFFLIRVFGGWDVTLGLDPWTKAQRPDASDIFIEYREDQVLKAGQLSLGPACAPLLPYHDQLLVLNGIHLSESDNGHEAASVYMSTGNGQGKAPDLPVEIAVAGARGAYGAIASFNLMLLDRPLSYVRAQDVLNSRNTADPADALQRARRGSPRSPLDRAIGEVLGSREITHVLRDQLRAMEAAGLKLVTEHAVAASFVAGACRQALFDFTPESGNLDTHSGHEGMHLRTLTDVFTRIASIFALFKSIPFGTGGESLFDRTTFMVISEFARTPALNGAKGKDHNPMTNSVLFAGAGIQGGKSVGHSLLIEAKRSRTGSSYHMAGPIDFATGASLTSRVPEAEFIYPEHVALIAARASGVDLSRFRSVPAGTKLVPGVVR